MRSAECCRDAVALSSNQFGGDVATSKSAVAVEAAGASFFCSGLDLGAAIRYDMGRGSEVMSNKLDDELAQAAGLGSEEPARTSAPPVAVGQTARKVAPKTKTNLGLLVTLLVMVGALVALFMVGFKDAAIYAKPVDDLLAEKDKLQGRKVRVEGELVPGSLERRDKPCEYRFSLHGKENKETLSVRYPQCIVPDTFRDVPAGGVQVTIEGTLKSANDFEATLVMAKCSSKYDAEKHEMKPGEGLPVN